MRRFLVVPLALAAVLAVPVAASALLQVDRGIAGVRLNNSQAQVRAAVGNPFRVINGTNDFGPFREYRYRFGLTVVFQGRQRVTAVTSTRRTDLTLSGVGVGTREAVLRARVRGLTCRTELGNFRHCFTHQFRAGQRVTDFRIRRGRVVSVTVAVVID